MTPIPLKQFLYEQSVAFGVCPGTVYAWLRAGLISGIREQCKNARVIDVIETGAIKCLAKPLKGEMPYGKWARKESVKAGVTLSAIHYRFYSGKYPDLEVRRESPFRVFVKLSEPKQERKVAI